MKLHEYEIKNMNMYINSMQKSVLDKMFFIDKVFEPFANIVDFGCANGELIKALHSLFGEYRYIGYDISDDMLREAKKNIPFADLYSDWDQIDADFSDSLLNISSTLHEVYSYSAPTEIETFWDRVFTGGFKYISIRDMMLAEENKGPADKVQLAAVTEDKVYAAKRNDYISVWGEIKTQHDLVHFLLKYRYTDNWGREVRENYVPITVEELLARIPDNYEIVYKEHFTLPYTQWRIQDDFGFTFRTPTHIKLILRRKDLF